MKKLCLFSLFFVFFVFPQETKAQENQFINVVNPVRVSRYTESPTESLRSQYQVILTRGLPATWLLTFDSLADKETLSLVKAMDDDQEVGVFVEVTPALAEKAGVKYRQTGFWHHATSLFLSGYTQEERVRLIDTLMAFYQANFEVYPQVVGAWWIDSFSLAYMQERYGVIANLGVADQFSTDGYQVWGQYWSTPFYPSKNHAGVPAANKGSKIDVVSLQWAARDPLSGYFSSLYSLQDYGTAQVGLGTDYYEKLVRLYASQGPNAFGQVTVGLEGDLEPETYKGDFSKQMDTVKSLSDSGEFQVIKASEFAKWYGQKFPDTSPPQVVVTKDLLETQREVFWYQSPHYRIGLAYDPLSGKTKVFDFRTYHENLVEPYNLMPNREFTLSIYVPSLFDEAGNGEDVWEIAPGRLLESKGDLSEYRLVFEKGEVVFRPGSLVFDIEGLNFPSILANAAVEIKGNEMVPEKNWLYPEEGEVVRDLSPEATHLIATRRILVLISAGAALFFGGCFYIMFSKMSERRKLILLSVVIIPTLSLLFYWYRTNVTTYFVSQGELDVLFRLSNLPEGRVLIYDNECLACEYHSKFKPAVFANKRGFVKKYGGHSLVYNKSVFEAKTQGEAKEEFDKLKAKYIYLSKYEDYIEKTPFSPGDLGIEKIYANANAELWRVKD